MAIFCEDISCDRVVARGETLCTKHQAEKGEKDAVLLHVTRLKFALISVERFVQDGRNLKSDAAEDIYNDLRDAFNKLSSEFGREKEL